MNFSIFLISLVNGKWGQWIDITSCTKSCGSGTFTRTRLCNNPPALSGGLSCLLSDGTGNRAFQETISNQPCNTQACPG